MDAAPPINTIDLTGNSFSLSHKRTKPLLLAFFRYASCPLCNLRVHELISGYQTFVNHFDIVAVFQSPRDIIKKYVEKQDIPFPTLPDPKRKLYQAYGVENSWGGFFKAWTLKIPMIFESVIQKGFFPGSVEGEFHRIPADFLISADNTIIHAYYGTHIGDHLPISEILKEVKNDKSE
jgi:peroxiredoxin